MNFICLLNVALDYDECSSERNYCPPNSTCENRMGSYNCICNAGYTKVHQLGSSPYNEICSTYLSTQHGEYFTEKLLILEWFIFLISGVIVSLFVLITIVLIVVIFWKRYKARHSAVEEHQNTTRLSKSNIFNIEENIFNSN